MTSHLQRLWQPTAVIALAQLLGTSLWFSINSAAPELLHAWGRQPTDIGWLTNATQGGFIVGTLILGLGGVGDRYRASSLFVAGAVLGAAFNAAYRRHFGAPFPARSTVVSALLADGALIEVEAIAQRA